MINFSKIFRSLSFAAAFAFAFAGPAPAQVAKSVIQGQISASSANGLVGGVILNNIVSSYVDYTTCTSVGGMLYWNSISVPTCLPIGFNGQSLTIVGGLPTWTNTFSSVVTSINGQTGAIVLGSITPQVRISLNTATPVMTANYAAQTTVYVTPYIGNLIPIYDGTNMIPTAFAEVSQATTDTTKSPAAVAANSVYDIFCWVDTGPTNRCTRGPAWSSQATRSAGTALVRVNGILLNSVSITNGPAASRGTYVGTIASDGSSAIDWNFGGVSASCSAAVFGVWNMYNRVPVTTFLGDSTGSWTYTTIGWRQAHGSSTCQVNAVRGFDEDGITASYNAVGLSGAGPVQMSAGVGVNSVASYSGTTGFIQSSTFALDVVAEYSGLMGLGYVYVAPIEWNGSGTTSSTWFGATTATQIGFHVRLSQ